MKTYEPQPDPVLKTDYCAGNNEIPQFWVKHRYLSELFLVVKRRVRDTPETEDVLSNVIEELCKTSFPRRSKKVPIINDEARLGLIRLSINRAIDEFRKNRRISHATESEFYGLEDERNFANELESKDLVQHLRQRLLSKYGEESAKLFDLLLAFPGEVKPIADVLGISADEVRKRKQKLVRQARRLKISLN